MSPENLPPNEPAITPAQILAGVSAILALLVGQSLIDDQTSKLLAGIASTLLPMILVAADWGIRSARNKRRGLEAAAKAGVAPQVKA